jgi:RNA polymerase sigma-70 factor (ECF subfamily)
MNKKDDIDEQEQELLSQLRGKAPRAFKVLVERYRDHVLNICYRFIFNREDAEDIAQEVFIEIHRSIFTFRGEAKLSTWIYRIAVTRSIDFIRKIKRKKRMAQIKSLMGIEAEVKNIPAPLDNDPAKGLEQEERRRKLREAVDSLPENQRIAFTLSKYKGLGNKEIADIMGTSLASVESLVHRAKNNLKKKLYRYFERSWQTKGKRFITFFFALFFVLIMKSVCGCLTGPGEFASKKIRMFSIVMTSKTTGGVLYLKINDRPGGHNG